MKQIAAVLFLLFVSCGVANASDKDTCVVASAAHVPPSLKVLSSKVYSRPGNENIRSFFLIKFAVSAAGHRSSFNYFCGVGVDGRAVVIRAGN